jgi:hypothetical protein
MWIVYRVFTIVAGIAGKCKYAILFVAILVYDYSLPSAIRRQKSESQKGIFDLTY